MSRSRQRDEGGATDVALGLDVGGTKVAGLLVDAGGRVRGRARRDTPAEDVEAIMETLYLVADELLREGPAVAVGVGAAGLVDFQAGVMRWAPNIAWAELPIRSLVAGHTGLPCLLDNDATAAAWGEYRFGAGQGCGHMLLVTVGTGIGGGIVVDGSLYRGAHGFAAEIGHFIVEPGGPTCGCGNRGCWEQVASGRALDRLGREAASDDPASEIARLAGQDPVTGRHVALAADRGDPRARGIIEEVGRRLGEGMAGLANILDPEVIVVGGGVSEVGEPLLGPARKAFKEAIEAPEHRHEVSIRRALLGNDAGAIGAAVLALEVAHEDGA